MIPRCLDLYALPDKYLKKRRKLHYSSGVQFLCITGKIPLKIQIEEEEEEEEEEEKEEEKEKEKEKEKEEEDPYIHANGKKEVFWSGGNF